MVRAAGILHAGTLDQSLFADGRIGGAKGLQIITTDTFAEADEDAGLFGDSKPRNPPQLTQLKTGETWLATGFQTIPVA